MDRVVAERFLAGLQSLGLSVWWDAGLQVGDDYDEATEAALRAAQAVVVLWSPRSVSSRWVRSEATLALRAGTLFPAMIEPCERPVMFELTQTADMSAWKGGLQDPAWLDFADNLKVFVSRTEGRPASVAATTTPPETGSRAFGVPRRQLGLAAGASVAALGLTGVGAWLWSGGGARPAAAERSLAVLPFQNISGAQDQEYFSEGLSAELRAALTRIPTLRVAAPTSSREAGKDKGDLRSVAAKLGVAFILQGTVAKAGGMVRVGADLIDVRAGLTKWSETYERSLSDVFAVQSDIASMVAGALAARIMAPDTAAGAGKSATGAPRTVGGSANIEAFEDFLHGREALARAGSEATDRQALAWFDAAIAKDPSYAAAHVWRARALSVLASQSGGTASVRQSRDAALSAARRAIELAPDYAVAHSTLAWVLFNQALDVRAARAAYDRARALGPGDADVLMTYSIFNARTGRIEDARRDIATALVLDPLNPAAFRFAGAISLIARDYESALAEFDRALALNPTAAVINAYRGMAFAGLDRWQEARNAYTSEPSATFKYSGLAIAAWKMGDHQAARSALAELRNRTGTSAFYQQAQVLAQMGDTKAALDALQRAFELGDAGLAQLKTDHFLEPLKSSPQFLDLIKLMGFD